MEPAITASCCPGHGRKPYRSSATFESDWLLKCLLPDVTRVPLLEMTRAWSIRVSVPGYENGSQAPCGHRMSSDRKKQGRDKTLTRVGLCQREGCLALFCFLNKITKPSALTRVAQQMFALLQISSFLSHSVEGAAHGRSWQ